MFELSCPRCHEELPLDFWGWQCTTCGGPLRLIRTNRFEKLEEIVQRGRAGIWRYSGAIPFSKDPITLGEGATPIIKTRGKGMEPFLKLEYLSPSGSFKDRGASVSLTRAKAVGARTVVEDSTGNAGIAASVYAARAGIGARVYVPADAPVDKKRLMEACGAVVVQCRSRGEAASRATTELGNTELYMGHAWDAFYLEGMKTVAFETLEAGIRPEAVIVPVASGTLLLGIYKGFGELLTAGLIEVMPRIYGVQGEGCAPIFEEIHGKVEVGEGSGLADGLRIANPPRKGEIVQAIESSGGDVFVVSDPEIRSGMTELYRMGIMAEPTSATALAALKKNERELGGAILIPITGSGTKNMEGTMSALGRSS